MQIIICKCCQQKLKPPGGAETGASVGGRTLVHEQVDGGEGDISTCDWFFRYVTLTEGDETGTSVRGEGLVHKQMDGGEGGISIMHGIFYTWTEGAETGTSAGGEGQEVDKDERGVAVSEHTYMEVGTRKERERNTFILSVNEAYATHM